MTVEALARGSSAAPYEVLAVRYGTLATRRRALFAAYDVYGEPDGPLQMDYYFWVVRNRERTVLVDTGFDPAVGRRRGRQVLCTPRQALERLDVPAASVSDVVLTHFHYDHIGNVGLFPAARLLAAARELAFWTGPYGRRPVPAAPVEHLEVEALRTAHAEGRLVLVPQQDAALPGIELLDLSGHTSGQLGVRVAVDGGSVVLASDAAHFYEETERDMPFHVYTDLEGMYRGFERLRELARKPGTVVVPGHDPEVARRFPSVADGLAVRLG